MEEQAPERAVISIDGKSHYVDSFSQEGIIAINEITRIQNNMNQVQLQLQGMEFSKQGFINMVRSLIPEEVEKTEETKEEK